MANHSSFSALSTVKFQHSLEPHADAIYARELRAHIDRIQDDYEVNPYDQELGIDGWLRWPHGTELSVQEKFRRNKYVDCDDIAFELVNANGSEGEWYYSRAQLRFYGVANEDVSGFAWWRLYDEPRLRLEVEKAGGVRWCGQVRKGREGGTFACVPITLLEPAVIASGPLRLDADGSLRSA